MLQIVTGMYFREGAEPSLVSAEQRRTGRNDESRPDQEPYKTNNFVRIDQGRFGLHVGRPAKSTWTACQGSG